ncbi:MAG TPA: NBR1-Ig-like domain-containing protein [Anaerolineales bacterium]|nr:NBR1-Ig-like domain-containing protein [Anaerolineales bacterium]
MTRRTILTISLIALVLIMTIGLRGSTQESRNQMPDFGEVQTSAVATFASNLTQTAAAHPTATPTLTPTDTATPIAITATEGTATPTPSCYRSRFLKDVTVPDFSPMQPGQTFTKTWRVLNNGTCAWQPGFRFAFYGGDPMGGTNFTLTQTVDPGQQLDLSIPMTAPGGTGIVISSWRLSGYNGWFFGDTLTAKINLGGETPTP